MTIGEIADRTITALARSWQPLLLTLIAAEFPAQVFSFAGVMRTREMYGSGIAVLAIFAGIAAFALSLALGPAQIALVNGADDMRTFMDAMRYGFRNFWLSLRCALLVVFTLGIAGGVVGGIAGGAAAAGGGRTAFIVILLIGGALLVPLYLVANLTLPIALFETGRATPAFGSAWRRSIGTDVRRSWLLGISLGLVGQAPSYVVGFPRRHADFHDPRSVGRECLDRNRLTVERPRDRRLCDDRCARFARPRRGCRSRRCPRR